MLPKRSIPLFAAAFVMVILGGVIPQPEVCITLITAGLLIGGFGVYVFFADRERKEKPLVDDEKHIILFRATQTHDENSVACPHCGEVYGLGIKVCPRCKRPA
ncbi:MAG TPA: hypothetical protein VHE55_19090 [Fimbriimonadaceae bacterium]|nr:hypothetical protein [Fimbriimonadaceae bacterium]